MAMVYDDAVTKQAAKTVEKIADYPFAQPGYLMKRALNFAALKAIHPRIYAALMSNTIFKLHPDVKSANFRVLDHIYSDFAPTVGEDSQLTDLFLDICRELGKSLPFDSEVVPFLTYRRNGSGESCDMFCVTPDELLIFGYSPYVAECIALEDIQAIAVQENAIIVNGISYPLKCSFAPIQEKYDLLVFYVGMALAMKYPAPMPEDDKPVVFEPQVVTRKPTAPKRNDRADAAMEKIMKLKQMLDAGVITQEEFSMIKARIIEEM